jgi:hypothetical protein
LSLVRHAAYSGDMENPAQRWRAIMAGRVIILRPNIESVRRSSGASSQTHFFVLQQGQHPALSCQLFSAIHVRYHVMVCCFKDYRYTPVVQRTQTAWGGSRGAQPTQQIFHGAGLEWDQEDASEQTVETASLQSSKKRIPLTVSSCSNYYCVVRIASFASFFKNFGRARISVVSVIRRSSLICLDFGSESDQHNVDDRPLLHQQSPFIRVGRRELLRPTTSPSSSHSRCWWIAARLFHSSPSDYWNERFDSRGGGLSSSQPRIARPYRAFLAPEYDDYCITSLACSSPSSQEIMSVFSFVVLLLPLN